MAKKQASKKTRKEKLEPRVKAYLDEVETTLYPHLITNAYEWVAEGWGKDDQTPPMLAAVILNSASENGTLPDSRDAMVVIARNIINLYYRDDWTVDPLPIPGATKTEFDHTVLTWELGHGEPKAVIGIKADPLGVDLELKSGEYPARVFVERRPGEWAIVFTPNNSEDIATIILAKDNGSFVTQDDTGTVIPTCEMSVEPNHTPSEAAEDKSTVYRNYYRHDECQEQPGVEWVDEHTAMCNDRCPACNREIEPYESDEIE